MLVLVQTWSASDIQKVNGCAVYLSRCKTVSKNGIFRYIYRYFFFVFVGEGGVGLYACHDQTGDLAFDFFIVEAYPIKVSRTETTKSMCSVYADP